MKKLAMFTLLLAACAVDHTPEAPPPDAACPSGWHLTSSGCELDAYTGPDASPEVDPPARIGDFCEVTCNAASWGAPGGGDDQCRAVIGGHTTVGCCLEDGTCAYGVGIDPACISIGPAPADETCPSDADGNGLCDFGGRIYKACGS